MKTTWKEAGPKTGPRTTETMDLVRGLRGPTRGRDHYEGLLAERRAALDAPFRQAKGRWEGIELRYHAKNLRLKAAEARVGAVEAQQRGQTTVAAALWLEAHLRDEQAAIFQRSSRDKRSTPDRFSRVFGAFLERYKIAEAGHGIGWAIDMMERTPALSAASDARTLKFSSGDMLSFMDDARGLSIYRAWFPGLDESLERPDAFIIDCGVGRGGFLAEVASLPANGDRTLVGVDLEAPPHVDGWNFVSGDARRLTALVGPDGAPLVERATLITDHHGPFSYDTRPDLILREYLAALCRGGRVCLTLSPRTLVVDGREGHPARTIPIERWLGSIPGVRIVASQPYPGARQLASIVLEKEQDGPIAVPELGQLLVYDQSMPPYRLYARGAEPLAAKVASNDPPGTLADYGRASQEIRRWRFGGEFERSAGVGPDSCLRKQAADLRVEATDLKFSAIQARDRGESEYAHALWNESTIWEELIGNLERVVENK